MNNSYIIVWVFAAVLLILVYRKKGYVGVKKSTFFAGNQALSISKKMPFALLTAAFITQLVPFE